MIFPIRKALQRLQYGGIRAKEFQVKKLYRHFNIRSVSVRTDFASMEEVLTRRFNRWLAAQEIAEAPGKKPDQSFALLPDLLLVMVVKDN